MNLNKKNKELLMYCALAFVAGYLMCMYYPVHNRNNGYTLGGILEGVDNNNSSSNNNSHEHLCSDHDDATARRRQTGCNWNNSNKTYVANSNNKTLNYFSKIIFVIKYLKFNL